MPEVTLERMIYEVYEDNTTVSLCVELKSNLERDLEVHLYLSGVTATGNRGICCDASVRDCFLQLVQTLMEHLH